MNRIRNLTKKTWSVILCAALLFAAVTLPVYGEEESTTEVSVVEPESSNAPLQIGVMSDLHYYPFSLTGNRCAAYLDLASRDIRQHGEGVALVDSALHSFKVSAAEKGLKYLLIPGDMTLDGEYEGHKEIAARLKAFEEETGVEVIVVNGNHDINRAQCISFATGTKKSTQWTTPEDFRELYRDLGRDLACAEYTPPAGQKAGMLSYAVQLEGGYRLLALDTCKYSGDANSYGYDRDESAGQITDDLMAWILDQIEQANELGETVIGLAHHPFIRHFPIHETIFQSFVLDDWERQCETLADAGMRFHFSGHIHELETASHVSDNGNIIYDICTSSLTGFPNKIREVLFDNTGDFPTADIKTYDVDRTKQVVSYGKFFTPPYSLTYSFKRTFGDTVRELLVNNLSGIIYDLFDSMKENGGLVGALKDSFGLDIETLLDGLLGGGIKLGPIDILTTKNLMSFVNDIGSQLEKTLLKDPDELLGLVGDIADQLLNIKVSNLPCTKFISSHGFGSASRPGTLQDLAYSVLAYFYGGDQDISDDPFIQDAFSYFRDRDGGKDVFDVLYDVLVHQLVEDQLLSKLQLNIDKLFPFGTFGSLTASMLQLTMRILLGGDTSYLNVIETVLSLASSLGLFDFKDLDGLIGYFAGEYLTQSQFDSLGYTIAGMLDSFVWPDEFPDKDVLLTAFPENEVAATQENYRLPSMVTVTLGQNAATSRNISWYTKYSAKGTDIELIPYSDNPEFTGTATTGSGIMASYENVTREYPAVDLGFIGFMTVTQKLVRHTLTLTNLTPNTKYSYRVGDAEKGWWSEPGVIETADGSNTLSFIHVTDPQSQNDRQYGRFNNVIGAAFNTVPGADFVVSTGDQVDIGTNVKQWKWLLDISSDKLMKTAFMPTAGNHEDKGKVLDTNFILPNVPAQDTESGVYYSFDYNNARFMVLNTNDLVDNKLSDAQIAWLKKCAGESGAQWKIVALHKAPYSNGSHYKDSDVEAIRGQLQKLMPDLGIDIVLQGHDHVYLRTGALYNNKLVKATTKTVSYGGNDYTAKVDPYGTIYVISGTAGVKTYKTKSTTLTDKSFPRAEGLVDTELSMFSAFKIDGGRLYFDAYTVSNDGSKVTRVDSFAIEKTAAGAQKPCIILEDGSDALAQAAEFVDDVELGNNPSANSAEDNTDVSTSESAAPENGTANASSDGSAESSTTSTTVADSVDDGVVFGNAVTKTTATAASAGSNTSTTRNNLLSSIRDRTTTTRPATTKAGAAGNIPKSGSESPIIVVAVLFGAAGLWLALAKKKKPDEEE
ncbi:MAG: metallophosphoesterase [Oscillospiraceae bacterium]|nr:metallophosphoesterase [Oscillospiraceae bacterium]